MTGGLEVVARRLADGGRGVALTGAGISVESGIPDFRSRGGLWERFDPAQYATLGAFRRDPAKVWKMFAEMEALLARARPNRAHRALADLEAAGVLQGVVTQNIDGLHQGAGSRRVVEFHGTHRTLTCLDCGARLSRAEARARGMPPRCVCGALLKPDIVLFGEEISPKVSEDAHVLAARCRVLLVVGTSAEVSPANELPHVARGAGAQLVEINLAPTPLTPMVDHFLQGAAGRVLPALVKALKPHLGSRPRTGDTVP